MWHVVGRACPEGRARACGGKRGGEAREVMGMAGGGGQVKKVVRKARLQYHPDRYQTSELEQQIKAEEIFKLLGSLL